MLKGLLADLGKQGLSANTVRLVRASMSVMFGEAVDDGLLAINPALSASRRRADKTARGDKLIAPSSEVELERFLAAAVETSIRCFSCWPEPDFGQEKPMRASGQILISMRAASP